MDLISYTPWGIIDIVSFTTGEMKKRYGLIHLDRNNEGNGSLERTKKLHLIGIVKLLNQMVKNYNCVTSITK